MDGSKYLNKKGFFRYSRRPWIPLDYSIEYPVREE